MKPEQAQRMTAVRSQQKWLLILFFVLLPLTVTIVFLTSAQAVAQSNSNKIIKVINEETVVGPNCRYGVASWNSAHNSFISELGAGWVQSFGLNNPGVPSGVEFVATIRLNQLRDQDGKRLNEYELAHTELTDSGLGALVDANPGRLWLVGNEVDRFFHQDDIMPQLYAEAYHDVYWFIKDRDPTAQVAISGLVQVTPGRLQYLDIVLDTYLEKYGTPMPVDVWNMHIYILPERRRTSTPPYYEHSSAAIALGTDPELAIWESDGTPAQCPQEDVYCFAEHDDINIFIQQVRNMRQWMKERGQRNKPLIMTEFSLLYPYTIDSGGSCFLQDEFGNCFTPQRTSDFMTAVFNYLESATDPNIGYPLDNNRLVQQWLWYAMNDGLDGTPNKLVNDSATALTLMGTTYKNYVAGQPLSTNLIADRAFYPIAVGQTAADIGVSFRNNGNAKINQSFTVTFYSDTALSNEIGSVTVPATVNGCAREAYTATVNWSGLQPGVNRYWAVIDSQSNITEADEDDNLVSGYVLVDPDQIYLPFVQR